MNLKNIELDALRLSDILVSGTTNCIKGNFKSTYVTSLGNDSFKFDLMSASPVVEALRESNTYPVRIYDYTKGFEDNEIVAIFPEFFNLKKVTSKSPVFFFITRFRNRHLRYTRPTIANISFFHSLVELNDKEVDQLVTDWVVLHEHFHQMGSLPLFQNLKLKSSSLCAAVEELKVDLMSILFCLNHHNSNLTNLYKYILSERYYCYKKCRNKDSFDYLSSEILNKIIPNSDFKNIDFALSEFLIKVESIEFKVSQIEDKSLMSEELNNNLRKLIKEYGVEF